MQWLTCRYCLSTLSIFSCLKDYASPFLHFLLGTDSSLSDWYSWTLYHQPQAEDDKKELMEKDVQESFDITYVKHKGQVWDLGSLDLFWIAPCNQLSFDNHFIFAWILLFFFLSMLCGNCTMRAQGFCVYYIHRHHVVHAGLWNQFLARYGNSLLLCRHTSYLFIFQDNRPTLSTGGHCTILSNIIILQTCPYRFGHEIWSDFEIKLPKVGSD